MVSRRTGHNTSTVMAWHASYPVVLSHIALHLPCKLVTCFVRPTLIHYEYELLQAEFVSHFRNISRIMDCVGCDKCKLWGKLQVTMFL